MHSIRCKNVKNTFEHLNKSTQTTFNEHDFTINNKKDLHDIK